MLWVLGTIGVIFLFIGFSRIKLNKEKQAIELLTERMSIVFQDIRYSSYQTEEIWKYAFQIELAYMIINIFTYTLNIDDKNNERTQLIANVVNIWIGFIIKLYGINNNEKNIRNIKLELDLRYNFYADEIDRIIQNRPKNSKDFYLQFLSFSERHYDFRGNLGFEPHDLQTFVHKLSSLGVQMAKERINAEMLYTNSMTTNKEVNELYSGRELVFRQAIINCFTDCRKYRQKNGFPLILK